ncbi:RadC family protein [Flavihumibacter petaseus]|uniref:MPN domain-containing protein n=1 Tax=Flavihumibacter petaseus NBRC 106054 TaxID=1220578 RepID=A0A0E9N7C8_9BACT|nr:DNA repair protein RadC [Flavihumibacter petaseus]GAO45606.1 hypothetical protein FPE01S_06_00970 [Flavihumibacter petaseus NBRC 106054]
MQAQNHSIKSWAKADRPREKLLSKSPMHLSDAELLSILLVTGYSKQTALDIARDLLARCANNLFELGRMSAYDLMKIKGIGYAKAVTITAALELGRRRQTARVMEQPVVSGSADVANHLRQLYQDHHQEVFVVLFLNRANMIRHQEVISLGGIAGTVADPRIIMKKAIEQEASSLILSHNHPSGNLKPSRADEDLTQRIAQAARLLDIRVIDHIIVSQQGYFSFADEGLL